MAHSEYGRDNIATIIWRHGMRMNRILRIAFLCLTARFALNPQLKAPCGHGY